jgi:uncharacterized protein YqgV (UPF0045/DUF77 family)
MGASEFGAMNAWPDRLFGSTRWDVIELDPHRRARNRRMQRRHRVRQSACLHPFCSRAAEAGSICAANKPGPGLMRTTVEISLYPLTADYIPPIQDFIDRLNTYPELDVTTNPMSTQVAGEHGRVFEILAKETAASFAAAGRKVFVMKILGPG